MNVTTCPTLRVGGHSPLGLVVTFMYLWICIIYDTIRQQKSDIVC